MPPANLEKLFPDLRNQGYEITSPADPDYNCVSWAAGDTHRRWWDPNRPDGYWPEGVEPDSSVETFVQLFRRIGFEECDDGNMEADSEKVAIYGLASGDFAHVALQLPSGTWTSKLGELEDIQHQTLDALVCRYYGQPVRFLRRAIRQAY